MKDPRRVPVLLPLVDGPDRSVAIEAIRALGRIGDAAAAPALLKIIAAPKADPMLRLEAVTAIGGIGGEAWWTLLLDALGDPSPSIRAAALRSLAQLDRGGLRHRAVRPRSGSALERAGGARRRCSARCRRRSGCRVCERCSRIPTSGSSRRCSPRSRRCARPSPPTIAERLKTDDAVVRAAAATALGAAEAAERPGDADRGVSNGAEGRDLRGARGGAGGARRVRRRRGDADV